MTKQMIDRADGVRALRFANDRGVQGRPWSRSIYVSPDPFSGYASWMLPGLRYEIETDDRADLPGWERVYIDAVRNLAQRMRAVAAMMP
ncbi:hypothetical protein [Candidatus Palauibacter sp.]|uniref:hypothetical protein n=1 Tax=Candidatus Palauibacter sp. TaxID=3101350 RepID=UPI003B012F3C